MLSKRWYQPILRSPLSREHWGEMGIKGYPSIQRKPSIVSRIKTTVEGFTVYICLLYLSGQQRKMDSVTSIYLNGVWCNLNQYLYFYLPKNIHKNKCNHLTFIHKCRIILTYCLRVKHPKTIFLYLFYFIINRQKYHSYQKQNSNGTTFLQRR